MDILLYDTGKIQILPYHVDCIPDFQYQSRLVVTSPRDVVELGVRQLCIFFEWSKTFPGSNILLADGYTTL